MAHVMPRASAKFVVTQRASEKQIVSTEPHRVVRGAHRLCKRRLCREETCHGTHREIYYFRNLRREQSGDTQENVLYKHSLGTHTLAHFFQICTITSSKTPRPFTSRALSHSLHMLDPSHPINPNCRETTALAVVTVYLHYSALATPL
jgi:hypothetical protein